MALPCTLGSELILYFATGGEKKLSSKPFSLGEKPAWSETSAQKCHLIQQLAPASPGVLRRPLPVSQRSGSGCRRKRARPLVLASSGRSLPPAGFTTPYCLRICLCPSAAAPLGGLGGSGRPGSAAGARGWRLRPPLPPDRQRAAAVEKDAATLSPVSTSHSFHWRVKISNFFF